MSPKQRMLFLIEHMNTPFKEEIKRDFEESLNEAKADELESTGVIGGDIYHYNDDGSTVTEQARRIKKLRGELDD